MNTMKAGGQNAHRLHALALRLSLGLPVSDTGTSAITFCAVTTVSIELLEAIARKAADDRQDTVISVYRDEGDAVPTWHLLAFRMSDRVDLLEVRPACQSVDKPLVLVAADGARQFELDERGIMREVTVSKAAHRSRAYRKAAARIAATAEQLEPMLDLTGWEATHFAFQADGTAVQVRQAAA